MNMYREELLDHYWHPQNYGTAENPSFLIKEHNPLCGDSLMLSARVENGIIADIKFNGKGCAISQASASLLTGALIGKNINTARAFSPDDLFALLKVPISPARQKCALLSFNAFKNGAKTLNTPESIKQALKQVKDPEINCDIVSLGLIYEIRMPDADHIEVDMTLTSINCPLGPYLLDEVKKVLYELNSSQENKINLIWEPAWSKDRIDPLIREELMFG